MNGQCTRLGVALTLWVGREGEGSRQKFRGRRRDLRFVNLIRERLWCLTMMVILF